MALRSRLFAISVIALALVPLLEPGTARAQGSPASLDQTGQVNFEGRATPYRIRNLPVSSFPDLPSAIAAALTRRGCIIPQTYEAKRPENVIHASLERSGSNDWAVLCSTEGHIALLVFFANGSPDSPAILTTSSWQRHLSPHGATGELGFDWGIDPASPRRIHDAQAAMPHRPPAPDHDAIADTTIDRGTVYHLYRNGAWEMAPTE